MSSDLSSALLTGYLCLAQALHKRGVLDIEDLVIEIGNSLDFRRARGIPEAELMLLQTLYESVRGIAAERFRTDVALGKKTPDA